MSYVDPGIETLQALLTLTADARLSIFAVSRRKSHEDERQTTGQGEQRVEWSTGKLAGTIFEEPEW